MSVTNLNLNGNIYALMESTVRRPKANERWFAICPLKGDGKWFAKTKEELIARLEEEEGVKASEHKLKKIQIWRTDSDYNGKPIVQWYSDGTMDVDTPTARFRIEMYPVSRGGRVQHLQYTTGEDEFDYFCDELLEANDSSYMRTVLTKIRLKNPDGTTLRDIDGLTLTMEDGNTTPLQLLDEWVDNIVESGCNDLVSFVYAFRDGNDCTDILSGCSVFTPQITQEAQAVFMVIDAMKFMDDQGCNGAEIPSEAHHHNSDISTEDARRVLSKIQSAATELSSIL